MFRSSDNTSEVCFGQVKTSVTWVQSHAKMLEKNVRLLEGGRLSEFDKLHRDREPMLSRAHFQ